MLLDSVQIGAPDIAAARDAYETLLGVTPWPRATGGWRFPLARGAVEIVGEPAGLRSVTFVADRNATLDVHGVTVHLVENADPRPAQRTLPDAAHAIDHVVIRSTDPARAIATWRDRFGLRLALDREFPARNLRLLFFRSNHITLEIATPLPPPAAPEAADLPFGVTYRVPDLPARRAALHAAGVDVSDIRPGMRTGTHVLTARSHTAGVPTLLLQLLPEAGA